MIDYLLGNVVNNEHTGSFKSVVDSLGLVSEVKRTFARVFLYLLVAGIVCSAVRSTWKNNSRCGKCGNSLVN